MRIAFDLYAQTNPAFCAAVLAEFCETYRKRIDTSPSLVTAYLILPITMSEDLAPTFEGTNARTGFSVWLHRNPQLCDGLAKRVNGTLPVTTEAIRFGCISKQLILGTDGLLSSLNRKLPKTMSDGAIDPAFLRARLLGAWIAEAGSPRAVMEGFGVSV
jgi:hypothetical protein